MAAVNMHPPRLSCVGVDPTFAHLARARDNVSGATLTLGEAEYPPLREASLGVACLLNVPNHLNDQPALFAALARLCRPGGKVFLCTFADRATLVMRLADVRLRLRNPAWQSTLSVTRLKDLIAHESRLTIADEVILKAGPFWRLQIYRLSVGRGDLIAQPPPRSEYTPPRRPQPA